MVFFPSLGFAGAWGILEFPARIQPMPHGLSSLFPTIWSLKWGVHPIFRHTYEKNSRIDSEKLRTTQLVSWLFMTFVGLTFKKHDSVFPTMAYFTGQTKQENWHTLLSLPSSKVDPEGVPLGSGAIRCSPAMPTLVVLKRRQHRPRDLGGHIWSCLDARDHQAESPLKGLFLESKFRFERPTAACFAMIYSSAFRIFRRFLSKKIATISPHVPWSEHGMTGLCSSHPGFLAPIQVNHSSFDKSTCNLKHSPWLITLALVNHTVDWP